MEAATAAANRARSHASPLMSAGRPRLVRRLGAAHGGKALGDGQTEIFIAARQHEKFGVAIGAVFLVSIERTLDGNALQTQAIGKALQFGGMAALVRPHDLQPPFGMFSLDCRPGPNKIVETFLRMNAAQGKRGALPFR